MKDGIRAGEEAQRLRLGRRATPAGAQADQRRRHQDARRRDRAHQLERISRRPIGERRARDADQQVDRARFRDADRATRAAQQAAAVVAALAHADDAAAADGDPGAPHARERREPVVVRARRDDVAVELRRRVEVVVVGGEAGLGERSACASVSMPSVQQASMPSARTPRTISSTRSNSAPRGTSRQAAPMQKRVAPALLRAARRLPAPPRRPSGRCRCDAGLVVRRLRTVRAVLRAAAGLDAEEHAALHLFGTMMRRCASCARKTRSGSGAV